MVRSRWHHLSAPSESTSPFSFSVYGPWLTSFDSILELFRADFGGGMEGGGVRVMTGPNPLAMLSTLLNFDRHGDAVYSQEELDRVISQLIDQNLNRTGAPPAPQSAIRAMPVGVGQPVEYSVQAAHHRYQWVYGHLSLVHGSAHVKAAATQSGGGGCESKPAIGGPICTT